MYEFKKIIVCLVKCKFAIASMHEFVWVLMAVCVCVRMRIINKNKFNRDWRCSMHCTIHTICLDYIFYADGIIQNILVTWLDNKICTRKYKFVTSCVVFVAGHYFCFYVCCCYCWWWLLLLLLLFCFVFSVRLSVVFFCSLLLLVIVVVDCDLWEGLWNEIDWPWNTKIIVPIVSNLHNSTSH